MLNRLATRMKGVAPIQSRITKDLFDVSSDLNKPANFLNFYAMARLSQAVAQPNDTQAIVSSLGIHLDNVNVLEGKNDVRVLRVELPNEIIFSFGKPGLLDSIKVSLQNDDFFKSDRTPTPNPAIHDALTEFNRYCNLDEKFYRAENGKRVWYTGHGVGASLASLVLARQPESKDKFLATFDPLRFGDFNLLNNLDRKFSQQIFQFINRKFCHALDLDQYPIISTNASLKHYVHDIGEVIAKEMGLTKPNVLTRDSVPLALITHHAMETDRYAKEVVETADKVINEVNQHDFAKSARSTLRS